MSVTVIAMLWGVATSPALGVGRRDRIRIQADSGINPRPLWAHASQVAVSGANRAD